MPKDLADKLEALKPASHSSLVRALLPVIERQMAAGVTASQITELLRSEGRDINVATFRQILYRMRQESAQTANDLPVDDANLSRHAKSSNSLG